MQTHVEAQQAPTACTPHDTSDVSVLDCQGFCAPSYHDAHCALCKCAGCDFCACASSHRGDTPREECSSWCDVAFPVSHGPTSPDTFVSDAAKVIRGQFMARDPESVNFNVTAFAKVE